MNTEYEWTGKIENISWQKDLLDMIKNESEFNLLTESERLKKAYNISYWALMWFDILNYDYLVKHITIINHEQYANDLTKISKEDLIIFTFENDIDMNFYIYDDKTLKIDFIEVLEDEDDDEYVEKNPLKLQTVKEKFEIKNKKRDRFRGVLYEVESYDTRFKIKLRNNEVIIDEVACMIMMNNASEFLIKSLIEQDINIKLHNGWLYIS